MLGYRKSHSCVLEFRSSNFSMLSPETKPTLSTVFVQNYKLAKTLADEIKTLSHQLSTSLKITTRDAPAESARTPRSHRPQDPGAIAEDRRHEKFPVSGINLPFNDAMAPKRDRIGLHETDVGIVGAPSFHSLVST
jgi:hypothetical protein